jgi:2-succinyl-5-enolpyruvyl-6-hydroxy-3-cyclohexene-1-carboxylate synthase
MFREPLAGARPSVELPPSTLTEPLKHKARYQSEFPGGDTLVIAGACRRPEALAAAEMATRLGCPLLADVTSGMRALAYDHAVLQPEGLAAHSVIHVGGRVTSKRLWQFLDAHPPRHYLHIASRHLRIDPIHRQTDRLVGPIAEICSSLELADPCRSEFARAWTRASTTCHLLFQRELDQLRVVTEPGIARAIARLMPGQHGLFLANSMPVRDMDMFGFWPATHEIHVGANRGASGIDGLVASAVGFARGVELPTTLVIGDLALLHDLNSLALVPRSQHPIVVVVVNNNGGGIFHFLPIAAQTEHFERFFATPHGFDFSRAADMFRLGYLHPTTLQEFGDAYRAALAQDQPTVIEVSTDRDENMRIHQQLLSALMANH